MMLSDPPRSPVPTGSASGRTSDREGLRLARLLIELTPILLDTLVAVATRASAEDELARSVAALARSDWELARNRPPRLGEIAVFMPSNNVLYSYVLYALIPLLFADRVVVRPSSRVRETSARVYQLLSEACPMLDGRSPALSDASQRAFSHKCANADMVIFTGRHENSAALATTLANHTRLLRFGSGPNPVVVGERAELELAVRDVVAARLYNSGQDCLCPDVIFVHRRIRDAFMAALRDLLDRIAIGERSDPDTIVGPLIYRDALAGARAFLTQHHERLRYGGHVDEHAASVSPAIVELPFLAGFHPPELFSPIFCVVPYDDGKQIECWLHSPVELERGMYVSVYGEPLLKGETLGTSVMCRGLTALDAENGNAPFGGFGVRASSVLCGGTCVARPLLASSEARLCPPPRKRSG